MKVTMARNIQHSVNDLVPKPSAPGSVPELSQAGPLCARGPRTVGSFPGQLLPGLHHAQAAPALKYFNSVAYIDPHCGHTHFEAMTPTQPHLALGHDVVRTAGRGRSI